MFSWRMVPVSALKCRFLSFCGLTPEYCGKRPPEQWELWEGKPLKPYHFNRTLGAQKASSKYCQTSTAKQRELWESKTGWNRTLATVLWVPLILFCFFVFKCRFWRLSAGFGDLSAGFSGKDPLGWSSMCWLSWFSGLGCCSGPGFHLRLGASHCSPGLAFCFMGPWTFAWICCPQLPDHPCKNGTHSTCFYSTGGHAPSFGDLSAGLAEKKMEKWRKNIKMSRKASPSCALNNTKGWGFSRERRPKSRTWEAFG